MGSASPSLTYTTENYIGLRVSFHLLYDLNVVFALRFFSDTVQLMYISVSGTVNISGLSIRIPQLYDAARNRIQPAC